MRLSQAHHQKASVEKAFFIPDLCQAQAVFFLVIIAELLATVLVIVDVGLRQFDWVEFALQSLYVQWVVLLSAAILCILRPWLSSMTLIQSAAMSYGLILGVNTLSSVLAQLLQAGAVFGGASLRLDLWRMGDQIFVSAVLGGIALRYFYLTHQLRMREQAALSSQLAALQARIRPHFLFNTMNSIASLIAIDPVAAEKSIEDLSDLFRASIARDDAPTTLANELDVCRGYVRIEQWRLGRRLSVSWQIDDAVLDYSIPSLTIQPLIENAIYHGIESRANGGLVEVIIRRDEAYVKIVIRNPLSEEKTEKQGNRLALVNTRERLKTLYGEDAMILTEEREGFFEATIRYKP